MEVKVLIFGQLTDITGEHELHLNGVRNTDEALEKLINQFPALIGRKYRLAVNQQMIDSNTKLENDSVSAIMPPFSGG